MLDCRRRQETGSAAAVKKFTGSWLDGELWTGGLEGGAVLRKKKRLYSLEGPWAGDKYDLLGS